MSSNNNKGMPTWAIAVMIALFALNLFQWFNHSKLQSNFQRQETALFQLEKVSTELESDFESAMESLEELRSDNQLANELIESQKDELKNQKAKINELIWTKREYTKAKSEISKLNASLATYIEDVNKLKAENEQLMASNSQLSNQNTVLTQDLTRANEATTQLTEERNVLSSEKAKLDESNKELSIKVDMAEAIKLNYIKVESFERKKDGGIKEQKKVKKLDFLRACFVTETNMVTPAGEKEFKIRYIDPTGETLAVEELGSGVLTDKLTEKKVRYTAAGTINYNNDDHTGCIDWTPNFKLTKGEYQVEIYNRSFMVGKATFKLK